MRKYAAWGRRLQAALFHARESRVERQGGSTPEPGGPAVAFVSGDWAATSVTEGLKLDINTNSGGDPIAIEYKAKALGLVWTAWETLPDYAGNIPFSKTVTDATTAGQTNYVAIRALNSGVPTASSDIKSYVRV